MRKIIFELLLFNISLWGENGAGICSAQRVESFPLNEVRLLSGEGCFSKWSDNQMLDSAWIMSFPVKRLLHNFQTTAGVFAGLEGGYSGKQKVEKLGGWESMDCDLRGHAVGHLLSAYALMANSLSTEKGKAEAKQKGDSLVAGLRECQQMMGTGYISAFPEGLLKRNLQGKSVWAPWYTLHKIVSGLIMQYRMCNNDTALAICKDFTNWADRFLSPYYANEEVRQRALRNEFGGIGQCFYELHEITRDERDMKLCNFFYQDEKMNPLYAGNFDMGTMHCNTFLPKVMCETVKSERGAAMASNFWHSIVKNHVLAPGCLSDKEHFFDPKQTSKHLTGNTGETCCTYNLLKLTRELYSMNPNDPQYFNYFERALYNHILGQQDPQTGMVHYFLPTMTGAYKLYSTYDKSFWCCVGSSFESHAKYGESIYWKPKQAFSKGEMSNSSSADTVYINLFIPSELKTEGIDIRMETEFPLSEDVKLNINTKRPFVLIVRQPGWTGKQGYKTFKVKKGQTKLSVKEKMSLHIEATPDDPNRIALFYGPILLAGQLGEVADPFSNPANHNDYYGFDYKVPERMKNVKLKIENVKRTGALEWETEDGIKIKPLYDTHRERYVVYWNKK